MAAVISSVDSHDVVSLRVSLGPLTGTVLVSVVPMFTAPDAVLTIRGSGFDVPSVDQNGRPVKGATVNARGVDVVGGTAGALRVHGTSATELCVFVPSLRELQSTKGTLQWNVGNMLTLDYAYQRNAIVLPFVLSIQNRDGSSSPPIVLAVTLPPPTVGAPHVADGVVTIGNLTGGAHDTTEGLGRPAVLPDGDGGEIRWYSPSAATDVPAFDLDLYLPALKFPDLEALAKRLWDCLFTIPTIPGTSVARAELVPQTVWDNLAAARDLGTRLEPNKNGWHDDGVTFALPAGTPFGTAGVAVIWRDDLPAVPVPIWNLGFDCSDEAQRQTVRDTLVVAAHGLWSCLPSVDVKTPIAPGEWVPLILERVAGDVDNVVARLLEDTGLTVMFGFAVTVGGVTTRPVHGGGGVPANGNAECVASSDQGAQSAVNLAASYASATVPRSVGPADRKNVSVRLRPDLVPYEGQSPARDNSRVTLQLLVSFEFAGCSNLFDDIPIGPPITF